MFLDPLLWIATWQCSMIALWLYWFSRLPLESATLLFNTTWFGSAFLFFSILGDAAMAWLLPKKTPKIWYNKMKGATMFLGGMNSAMMLLSALVWKGLERDLFAKREERQIIFCCCSVGHFSQFVCNVPSFLVSKRLVKGETLTPVLRRLDLKWQELVWVPPDNTIFFIFVSASKHLIHNASFACSHSLFRSHSVWARLRSPPRSPASFTGCRLSGVRCESLLRR